MNPAGSHNRSLPLDTPYFPCGTIRECAPRAHRVGNAYRARVSRIFQALQRATYWHQHHDGIVSVPVVETSIDVRQIQHLGKLLEQLGHRVVCHTLVSALPTDNSGNNLLCLERLAESAASA